MSVKFTPFASALKAAVTKINNLTSEMDKKVNDFVDEVISKIVEYDEEYFTRGGNEETDKDDMKASIKDLFKMFQPEKKKSYSGYILYCQEERNNIKERNPDLNPAQVTSALGAQWKALDADEKAQYNLKAKSMKSMKDEEIGDKAGKAEKKSEKRASSKKPIVKDEDKSSKKAQSTKKEVDKVSKKAPSKKTEDKANKKAHSKKTEEKTDGSSVCKGGDTVKKSPMKSPNTKEANKKKDFDFSGEPTPIMSFKKRINLDENTEGKRWRYDPVTGLCFEMDKDILVARYINDELTWVKDLPENIKNWAKKAGYSVADDEEDIDIELEGDLSDDE